MGMKKSSKTKEIPKKLPPKEAKNIKSFRDELVKMQGILDTGMLDAEQFDFGKKSAAGKVRKVLQMIIVTSRDLRKAIVEKRKHMPTVTKEKKPKTE